MSDRILYAAFGSNMDPAQMDERAPKAMAVASGYLVNYRLRFARFADVVPCFGSKVPVVIWSLTQECLWSLDAYEGVPFVYVRERANVCVEILDYPVRDLRVGHVRPMMIYRMRSRARARMEPPPPPYLHRILNAYEIWGFDVDFVFRALIESEEISPT